MSEGQPPKEGSPKPESAKTGEQDGDAPSKYTTRLAEASKWAAGALGAVATTAVANLGLDRLGEGDLDGALIFWAYVGLAAFAVGVTSLIVAVAWHAHASRVTLGYLLSKSPIPKKIRELIEANKYMLGGNLTLEQFRNEMSDLVIRSKDGIDPKENERLQRLNKVRDNILETAKRERMRFVSARVAVVLIFSSLIATLGAATFALATNRDVALREDRIAREALEPTGELLPKTPSEISLAIPEEKSIQESVGELFGKDCIKEPVKAILLEVGDPPEGALPRLELDNPKDFHVVTERTKDCPVKNLWVPAGWISPRGPS